MSRKALAVLMLMAATAQATPADDLGKAYAAYRAGDFATARALARPDGLINADYALWIAAQSALLAGDAAAALPIFRSLAGMSASRFHEIAAWRAADALWALGEPADARAAYEKLVPAPVPPRLQTSDLSDGPLTGDAAVALDHIAASYAAEGNTAKAIAAWRRVAIEHPDHPLAVVAEARLAEAGAPLVARDRLARAERLSDGRGWDQALADLALVGDDQPDDVRTQRDYWIGMTLFRMRRDYARSAKLLLAVHQKMGAQAAEALFHAARAFSRADQDDEAIRWYREVVKRYPDTSSAAEAQFLSGWLEVNRGRWKEAIPALTATTKRYGSTRFGEDAVWYLGLCNHMLGKHKLALPFFEQVAKRGGEDGWKGRYWRARTLAALGKKDQARAELRKLVSDEPFTWYAILARARLAEAGVKLGPFGDADTSPRSDLPSLDDLDPALASDPLIAKAGELIAAGMPAEASVELRRGENAFLKNRGARGLPVLLDAYRRAESFNRPWELMAARGGRALSRPPEGAARSWWQSAYPLAYQGLVERYRGLGKNPAYYLYSIMQKESGYDPHVVSYADAIGLLQMIPPTTRRVAKALDIPYTDDFLYDPDNNIRAGSWYIGGLLEKFGAQIPIGSGSFNCGPKPVMRWLAQNGKRPIDEFVELVAYTQTRDYMKRVTAIYARYLYLHGGEDYQQPLKVDVHVGRDDIDY